MKQKHLTLNERETIEEMLKNNFNLTEIGKAIGKHRTTISKEILNHRFEKKSIQYGTTFANCTNINNCQFAGCKSCNKSCKNFTERKCELLNKAPYVCNGCKKKSHCKFSKFYYRAKDADAEYKNFRTESRIGIRISQEEIYEINNIITPLIKD